MKKKMLLIPLVLLLVISLVAIGCAKPAPAPTPAPAPPPAPAPAPAPPAETITLKAITAYPRDAWLCWPLFPFIDKIEERSNGQLTIEYVGGSEVMGEHDQYEAVSAGRMDIALNAPSYAPGVIPGGMALMLLEITSAEARAGGAHDYFNDIHKRANIFLLSYGNPIQGNFYLWIDREIKRPQELAGLKLGEGAIMPKGLSALGAIPTTVAWMEIYTALEQGIIDGVAITPATIYTMSWYEVVKYLVNVPFCTGDLTLIINLDKYNSLPEHLQELLNDTAIEMEYLSQIHFIRIADEYMQKALATGIEVIDFSPEDSKWFIETMMEAEWDGVLKDYPDIGPELKAKFSK